MAVDPALAQAIQQELSQERCALLDVIVDELEDLATPGSAVRGLASVALRQIGWLGPVVDTAQLSDPDAAADIQDIIRAVRPLKRPREHWAESVILDIGGRLTSVAPHLLSEDYGARIEAPNHGVQPFSLYKVLAGMVQKGRLPPSVAEGFATALQNAHRGPDVTGAEFARGDLGRVGDPVGRGGRRLRRSGRVPLRPAALSSAGMS